MGPTAQIPVDRMPRRSVYRQWVGAREPPLREAAALIRSGQRACGLRLPHVHNSAVCDDVLDVGLPETGDRADVRYLKNGAAAAVLALRGPAPADDALVLGGLNAESVGRRLTEAARAAGIEDRLTGTLRPGRPRNGAHRARRQHHRNHAGGRMVNGADGRPLLGRRQRRNERGRQVPVTAGRPAGPAKSGPRRRQLAQGAIRGGYPIHRAGSENVSANTLAPWSV